MNAVRQTLRIVASGHVDHGKSTIIGRLLAETGSVSDSAIDQIEAYCERNSKPFEYAFLLDALKDEQAQGITIDSARVFFKTAGRDYILFDTPGHIEFLKNMATGASQASAALFVIDAQEGLREDFRQQGHFMSILGIKQIAVLINKMDLIGYRQAEFERLKSDCEASLRDVGVEAARFIPVSGFHGDNIAAPSTKMDWHQGPTLLQVIESFRAEESLAGKPFRMPVQDVYKFSKIGDARRIVAGTIESGSVAVGDEIVFYPSGRSSVVRGIESVRPERSWRAWAGWAAGLTLEPQIYVRRGDLAALKKDPPPAVSTRLRAQLFWLGRSPLPIGKECVLKLGCARATARLESIENTLDAVTLESKANALQIGRHEIAQCILSLDRAVAFDAGSHHPTTGRFVLVDDGEIGGGGLILEALADRAGWVREKMLVREAKWLGSSISLERRQARYKQRASLILINGLRDSPREEAAKALEKTLFESDRLAYFGAAENHPEDIRRLAELAYIMVDAGIIFIVSAVNLTAEDIEIIRAVLDPDRIETVWVGGGSPEFIHGLMVSDPDSDKVVSAVMRRLKEKKIILKI